MAEEAQVVEQTIADEQVLKKYKEAGEITNSWVLNFGFIKFANKFRVAIATFFGLGKMRAFISQQTINSRRGQCWSEKTWLIY